MVEGFLIALVHGLSQDDIAKSGRALGLKWTSATVSDIERGKFAPPLSTVILLAHGAALIWSRLTDTRKTNFRHPGAARHIDETD